MQTWLKATIIAIAVIVAMVPGLVFFVGIGSPEQGFVDSGDQHQYRFWEEQLEFENNVHYNRVLFSYSNDYGATFSEPKDMNMTSQHAHEPKMIVMNGDVILVWRDEVPLGTPNLSFAKSTDFGKTFDKKRLFVGARPDIKYFGDTLHLTFVGPGWSVLYSKSSNSGETFSEPKLIFEIDWELNPYEPRPTPTLDVDADKVVITWSMNDRDGQETTWIAIDEGKDGSFDVSKSVAES